jgi:hypothetical protein
LAYWHGHAQLPLPEGSSLKLGLISIGRRPQTPPKFFTLLRTEMAFRFCHCQVLHQLTAMHCSGSSTPQLGARTGLVQAKRKTRLSKEITDDFRTAVVGAVERGSHDKTVGEILIFRLLQDVYFGNISTNWLFVVFSLSA